MNRTPLLVYMALLCLCATQLLQAQSLQQQLKTVYQQLDKSELATGYLYDQAVPMHSPARYRGYLNAQNKADMAKFGMVFGHLANSNTTATNSLDPSVYLDKIQNYKEGDPLEIATLGWDYDRIRPDALTENLLTESNNKLYDVANRPLSPYIQDTAFMAAMLIQEVHSLSPTFSVPSNLWFSNLDNTNPNVRINVGDGTGWHTIGIGGTYAASYPDTGWVTVKLRFRYNSNTIRFAHTRLHVRQASAQNRGWDLSTPDETLDIIDDMGTPKSHLGSVNSGIISVFYNCESNKMLKPLILVNGVEFGVIAGRDLGNDFTIVDDYMGFEVSALGNTTLQDHIESEGYDIIFVDWEEGKGADHIQRNAYALEEVIKWVNMRKAQDGSTEPNVIMSFSMGGLVTKYALLDMQNNGPAHDTRLFISYDAPLRGANIPLGTQLTIKYLYNTTGIASATGLVSPVPAINEFYDALDSPAPRQMLLYHMSNMNGTAEPNNPEHTALMAEIDAMGSLNMRHVAHANGAGNGTFLENSFAAGAPIYNLAFDDEFCVTLPVPTIVTTSSFPYFTIVLQPREFCDGEYGLNMTVSATGNNVQTTLFSVTGTVRVPLTLNTFSETVNRTCFTRPFDVIPGGTTRLGTIAFTEAENFLPFANAGTGLSGNHHCFIPTFSSTSSVVPSNFSTPQACGTPTQCSTPTSRTINPASQALEWNQEHVSIDERSALMIIAELANPYQISTVLNEYYNCGIATQSRIQNTTIVQPGKLSINNLGLVGYAQGGEPSATLALFTVRTECDAQVVVESQGELNIGDMISAQHGVLNLSEGSSLHIKSGGVLRITSSQSKLVISKNAKLILESGAKIILNDPDSQIEIEGTLELRGKPTFSGSGYWHFLQGNDLVYGAGYNKWILQGTGKGNRMMRVDGDVRIPDNKAIDLRDGKVEYGNATIKIRANGFARATNVVFEGANSGTAIDGYITRSLQFFGCDFTNLNDGIIGKFPTLLRLVQCNFTDNGYGIHHYAPGKNAEITSSTFVNSTAHFDHTKNVFITGSNFSTPIAKSSNSAAGLFPGGSLPSGIVPAGSVNLANVQLCKIVDSDFFDNAIGISSPGYDFDNSGTFLPSNVTLYKSIVRDNIIGIYSNGDASTGLVYASCTEFTMNDRAVAGQDALLALSGAANSPSSTVPNPNLFTGGWAPSRMYIYTCYSAFDPVIEGCTMLEGNDWGGNNPNGPIYIGELNNCANEEPISYVPTATYNATTCGTQGPPNNSANAEEWEGGFGDTGCEMEINNQEKQIHTIFHQGELYYIILEDEEKGLPYFQELADLYQTAYFNTASKECRYYISVAHRFVSGIETSERTMSEPNLSQVANSSLIFPNPSSEVVHVRLSEEQLSEVRLYDNFGKKVHEANAQSGLYSIETNELPSGMYSVEIREARKQPIREKLIIQHQ